MLTLDRRLALASLSACLLPPGTAFAASAARLGPPRDFSFAALAARAKKDASQPYKAPSASADLIRDIDYDAVLKIRFRPDHAVQMDGPYRAAFFHLSRYSH